MYIQSISMSLFSKGRSTSAQAVITIRDANGAAVSNADVSDNWSGLTNEGFSGTTDSNGQLVVESLKTKNSGTFTIRVINVSASGYTYKSSLNKVTSASISN